MRITYTGRKVELAPAQLRKIQAQFAKLGKLLDGKDEREAHVILSLERHLHRTEINVNYHNHPLVGIAQDADLFNSIHAAIQKLEKQAIKVRAKWRDTKRTPRNSSQERSCLQATPSQTQGAIESGERCPKFSKTPERARSQRAIGDHHRFERLGQRIRPQSF